MRCAWTLPRLVTIDLAVVAIIAASAIWIFGGSYSGILLPSTTVRFIVVALAFGLASFGGSWLCWQLRLRRPLGWLSGIPFWFGAVLVLCGGPVIALYFSQNWVLLVFCVWAAMGSYAYGFLLLNFGRNGKGAG